MLCSSGMIKASSVFSQGKGSSSIALKVKGVQLNMAGFFVPRKNWLVQCIYIYIYIFFFWIYNDIVISFHQLPDNLYVFLPPPHEIINCLFHCVPMSPYYSIFTHHFKVRKQTTFLKQNIFEHLILNYSEISLKCFKQ